MMEDECQISDETKLICQKIFTQLKTNRLGIFLLLTNNGYFNQSIAISTLFAYLLAPNWKLLCMASCFSRKPISGKNCVCLSQIILATS